MPGSCRQALVISRSKTDKELIKCLHDQEGERDSEVEHAQAEMKDQAESWMISVRQWETLRQCPRQVGLHILRHRVGIPAMVTAYYDDKRRGWRQHTTTTEAWLVTAYGRQQQHVDKTILPLVFISISAIASETHIIYPNSFQLSVPRTVPNSPVLSCWCEHGASPSV